MIIKSINNILVIIRYIFIFFTTTCSVHKFLILFTNVSKITQKCYNSAETVFEIGNLLNLYYCLLYSYISLLIF